MGKFKFISGLGNNDKNKVKDLVLLWMRAGADIIDVSPAVLPYIQENALNEGLDLNDYTFCVSLALKGDIHGKKAKINPDLCRKCLMCQKKCPQNAINPPYIDIDKCIGCKRCKKECKFGAINFFDNISDLPLNQIKKLDMVEFHISIKDKDTIIEEFSRLIKLFKEEIAVSICLNREYFSNKKACKIVSKLKKISGKREFTVQADGNPMTGYSNDFKVTMECVAFGIYLKEAGFNIILSGGTNQYTLDLVKNCALDCSIAYGSYARKLVEGKTQQEALIAARDFVIKNKEVLNA